MSFLRLSIHEHTATVILNRADKRNALNRAMLAELLQMFEHRPEQRLGRRTVQSPPAKRFGTRAVVGTVRAICRRARRSGRRCRPARLCELGGPRLQRHASRWRGEELGVAALSPRREAQPARGAPRKTPCLFASDFCTCPHSSLRTGIDSRSAPLVGVL